MKGEEGRRKRRGEGKMTGRKAQGQGQLESRERGEVGTESGGK